MFPYTLLNPIEKPVPVESLWKDAIIGYNGFVAISAGDHQGSTTGLDVWPCIVVQVIPW